MTPNEACKAGDSIKPRASALGARADNLTSSQSERQSVACRPFHGLAILSAACPEFRLRLHSGQQAGHPLRGFFSKSPFFNFSGRRIRTITFALISALAFALLTACGGKPFDVKTSPGNSPVSSTGRDDYEGLSVEAAAITDEDYIFETFDANLILAGVLPVKVTMTNQRTEPIEMKRARFEIRSSDSRSYRSVTGKKAFERVFSYYDITITGQHGYKESRSDFESVAFDTIAPLAPGESRQGLLFFIVPTEIARASELTITGRRLKPNEKKSDPGLEIKLK